MMTTHATTRRRLGRWLALALAAAPLAAAAGDGKAIIRDATEVLAEIMTIPERSIPPSLLRDSQAIAVIPGVVKVGFVLAGRMGSGIVLVRKGGGWSNPSFMTLKGGSIGFQIGAQSSDVVLVFKSRKGVQGMVDGKFTLGADAAVAAGPVGRRAEAATDAQLKAEIFAYSRSRGLFAGVSLEGSSLAIDEETNESYYGQPGITAQELFAGKGRVPAELAKFKRLLAKHTAGGR